MDRIQYINSANEKVDWKPGEGELDSNFKISQMFYQNRKCLEFKYILNVKNDSLNRHNYGLRIRLNGNLRGHYHFYSRSTEDSSFSRLCQLETGQFYNFHFSIEKIRYHDSFQMLKNPLHLFLTAPKIRDLAYLETLKRDFEHQHSASTLLLPLYRDSFRLKIRDDLFERYVDEVVARRERYAVDRNFDVETSVDFISTAYKQSFELNFSKVGAFSPSKSSKKKKKKFQNN